MFLTNDKYLILGSNFKLYLLSFAFTYCLHTVQFPNKWIWLYSKIRQNQKSHIYYSNSTLFHSSVLLLEKFQFLGSKLNFVFNFQLFLSGNGKHQQKTNRQELQGKFLSSQTVSAWKKSWWFISNSSCRSEKPQNTS